MRRGLVHLSHHPLRDRQAFRRAPAALAMLAIFWYAAETRSDVMMTYLWVWLGMVIWRRLTPGKGVTTEYQGKPWLTAWLVKNEMFARIAEAVLVFAVAQYMMPQSPPLGQFLVWVSMACGLKYWTEWLYLSRMDDITHDEVIMMQHQMNRFKKRR